MSTLLGVSIASATAVGGGSVCEARKARLSNGKTVFIKTRTDPPPGFFAAEARGLRLLAEAKQGVSVPEVLGCDDQCLVIDWIPTAVPTVEAAERFGRALAATHRHGNDVFGTHHDDAWISLLQLPNGPWDTWEQMWEQGRILPYLKKARDLGNISKRDVRSVEEILASLPKLAGPAEPPSLIHGDLWEGNILWGEDGRSYLIDPASHGGHRETDIAMLMYFGMPHVDRIIDAYNEAWPLADHWRDRLPVHQLHTVLVHTIQFGGSYGSRAGKLARLALQAG